MESRRSRESELKAWKARGAAGGCSGAPRRDPERCLLTHLSRPFELLRPGEGAGDAGPTCLTTSGLADGIPRSPGTPRWCWVCFRLAGLCTPCGRDSSIRAFLQGTLAERLQCGLRRAQGPLSTQTARSYPSGAHRPTAPTLWSVIFRFPGALEKPRAYRSDSIIMCVE